MKKKVLYLILATSIAGSHTNAQTLPNFVPPSPTSTEIAKAIEIPVTKSSGLANINIPIHQVQIDGVTLPIGLSYHGMGIKVEQRSGNVGLNWSLSSNWSITRNIRGLPDDLHSKGYMYTACTIDSVLSYYARVGTIERILIEYDWNRSLELEPDIFYLNAGTYSAKFFYNQRTRSFLVQSLDDIKIEPVVSVSGAGSIAGWKVNTPDGATYYFGVKDTSDPAPIQENNAQTGYRYISNGETSQLSDLVNYTTAWALRRVVTPNGREINITYQENKYFYYSKGGEANINGELGHLGEIQIIRNGITEQVVDSVICDTGIVTFEFGENPREDMLNAYAIEKINVYSPSGQKLKTVELGYDYYTSTDPVPAYLIPVSTNYRGNKRLRLRTVTESGTGSETLPPYKLDYNSDILPGVFSTSQDYWGYNNGKSNNGWPFLLTNYNTGYTPNRSVDPVQSAKGLLSKITFPTGGSVDIEYEGNLGKKPTGYDLSNFPHYYDVSNNRNRNTGILRDTSFWTGTRYEARFYTEDIIGLMNVRIDLPGTCPDDAYSSDCLYMVLIDEIPITKGTTSMTPLSNGWHTLAVRPKYPQQEDPLDFETNPFFVAMSWIELVKPFDDGYLRMGGSRVKKITRSDGNGNNYSTLFEYVDPNGEISGRTKVLPVYSQYLKFKYGSMLCSTARVYDPIRLDGSSGEGVVYSWVKEKRIGENAGMTYSHFNIVEPGNLFYIPPYPPANDRNYQGGQLVFEFVFDSDSTLLQHRHLTYNVIKDSSSVMGILGGMHLCTNALIHGDTLTHEEMGIPNVYRYFSSLNKIESETITTYSANGVTRTTTNYEYESPEHNQMTSKWIINSQGDTIRTKLYYANDAASLVGSDVSANENIIYEQLGKNNKHRLLEPVVTKSFKNSSLTSTSKVVYDNWGGGLVAVKNIMQSNGNNPLEDRITYVDYDAFGNPLEAIGPDGVHIALVWGYGKTYPIAKIVGATYSQVEAVLGTSFDPGMGGLSESQANELRQLIPNAQTYIYKYEVGVGMVEAIDPNGERTKYEYDDFNRLKLVRDSDDNIKQHYKYHYIQED